MCENEYLCPALQRPQGNKLEEGNWGGGNATITSCREQGRQNHALCCPQARQVDREGRRKKTMKKQERRKVNNQKGRPATGRTAEDKGGEE